MTRSVERILQSILASLQGRPESGYPQSEESLLRLIREELVGVPADGYPSSAEAQLAGIYSYLTGQQVSGRLSKEFLVRAIAGCVGQQSYERGLEQIASVLTPPSQFSVDYQVDQSSDDGDQLETGGFMGIDGGDFRVRSTNVAANRSWGAVRFHNGPFPVQGSIITAAYLTIWAEDNLLDDLNCDIHAQKEANPLTLSVVNFDITNRPRTIASSAWVEDDLGPGWVQSPPLVGVIQEVVDICNPTSFVLIFKPRSNVVKTMFFYTWDYTGHLSGAKLHLEWTEP